MKPLQQPRRGISLIEALVAMAVMAFGMLGVVGMQGALRSNADAAKQRSEAVRIAQETLEQWRQYAVLTNTTDDAASPYAAADYPYSYDGIANVAAGTVSGYITNTTYTRTGVVDAVTVPGQKTLRVTVSWPDRDGTTQTIQLYSVVSRVAPELTGTFAAPPSGGLAHTPGGRSRGIPPQAKNFGDGTSGFRPEGASNLGNVAWLFNNATGVITQICTTTAADNASLTLASLTCTTTVPHLLMSGFVRFYTGSSQPTASQVEDPSTAVPGYGSTIGVQVNQTAPSGQVGARTCLMSSASNYLQYFCAVPATNPATPGAVPRWSGTLELLSPSTTIAANLAVIASDEIKICRYRALASYTNQAESLINENLLVMRAGDGPTGGSGSTAFTCPSPTTFAHQPTV